MMLEKQVLSINLHIDPEEYALLEERILRISGVLDVGFNPVSGIAKITYNPLTTTKNTVLKQLASLGVEYSEVEVVKHRGRK